MPTTITIDPDALQRAQTITELAQHPTRLAALERIAAAVNGTAS